MKRILGIILVFYAVLVYSPRFAAAQTGGEIFRQEGIASWYGIEFDGRPTASGEIFNSSLFTAAHPSLPFGTLLNVTNMHNNKTVTVKVNDRGPFVSARIIDISMAAAEELDMIVTGTAPVLIQSVSGVTTPGSPAASAADLWSVPPEPPEPAPASISQAPQQTYAYSEQPTQRVELTPAAPRPPEPAPSQRPAQAQQPAYSQVQPAPAAVHAPPPAPAVQPVRYSRAALVPNITPLPQKKYRLQVGSYKVAKNALDSFDKLKNAGLNPAYERYEDFFRVVLPGIPGDEVFALTEKLGAAGFREAMIREER